MAWIGRICWYQQGPEYPTSQVSSAKKNKKWKWQDSKVALVHLLKLWEQEMNPRNEANDGRQQAKRDKS
jgi:hypothetical protein